VSKKFFLNQNFGGKMTDARKDSIFLSIKMKRKQMPSQVLNKIPQNRSFFPPFFKDILNGIILLTL